MWQYKTATSVLYGFICCALIAVMAIKTSALVVAAAASVLFLLQALSDNSLKTFQAH